MWQGGLCVASLGTKYNKDSKKTFLFKRCHQQTYRGTKIENWVQCTGEDILWGRRLLLYWHWPEVSCDTSASTHVTHIVLSHLLSITLGCNCCPMTWTSVQQLALLSIDIVLRSLQPIKRYKGTRPYIIPEGSKDPSHITPLLEVSFYYPAVYCFTALGTCQYVRVFCHIHCQKLTPPLHYVLY